MLIEVGCLSPWVNLCFKCYHDLVHSPAAPTPFPAAFQRGVTSPEIVAATTAHAAIDKACSLMNIRLIKVGKTFCERGCVITPRPPPRGSSVAVPPSETPRCFVKMPTTRPEDIGFSALQRSEEARIGPSWLSHESASRDSSGSFLRFAVPERKCAMTDRANGLASWQTPRMRWDN